MTNGEKTILIITVYRLPEGSVQGIHTQRAQINRKEKKVKTSATHRAKILKHLTRYIKSQKNLDDIIIAADWNQSIDSQSIQ